MTEELTYLPVGMLYPHPDNPRKDLGDLTELTDSIKANGVLQNLTVVPGHYVTPEEYAELAKIYTEEPTEDNRILLNTRTQPTGYTIIIGHRRWAAAKAAGLEEVPCVIAQMGEAEQIRTMLMENMQRSDLTVYEQAQGFQMMFDFGEGVADIAEATGFSQSTVRSRLDIAKLDKEKARSGVERGATLGDFAKLKTIKDDALREKCLDAIGTKNFENTLAQAKDEEKLKERIKEWRADLEKFATEISQEEAEPMKLVYVDEFAVWSLKRNVKVPEAKGEYVFVEKSDPSRIVLYRKYEESTPSPADVKKAERERKSQSLMEQFKQINTRHYLLRRDFVKKTAIKKSDLPVVLKFCANVLIDDNCDDVNHEVLADLLGIGLVKDQYYETVDEKAYQQILEDQPERVAFATAYAKSDSSSECYGTTEWHYEQRIYTLEHCENSFLDKLYETLEALGYQLSDEEKQMRDGTHSLFAKSAALIEKAKKDTGKVS